MELTKDMMKVDSDFSINDDSTIITAYIETWFDVDEKFGTDVNKDDDAWINFYANYNVETEELTCEYIVSKTDSCMAYEYSPTESEAELIKEMMQEACWKMHGCDLYHFANPMTMSM